MLLPRLLFLLLFLLLLASGRCHRGSSDRAEGRGAGRSQAGPAGPAGATEQGGHAPERAGRSNLESQLRDPKHKEKFIGHLTGPLYFKPRCRRQFHRLYHNTRDCTVPAYYKRCALLLTQLAKRPHCAER